MYAKPFQDTKLCINMVQKIRSLWALKCVRFFSYYGFDSIISNITITANKTTQ